MKLDWTRHALGTDQFSHALGHFAAANNCSNLTHSIKLFVAAENTQSGEEKRQMRI